MIDLLLVLLIFSMIFISLIQRYVLINDLGLPCNFTLNATVPSIFSFNLLHWSYSLQFERGRAVNGIKRRHFTILMRCIDKTL